METDILKTSTYQRQPAPPPRIRAARLESKTMILVFMEEFLLFLEVSSQAASIGKEYSLRSLNSDSYRISVPKSDNHDSRTK